MASELYVTAEGSKQPLTGGMQRSGHSKSLSTGSRVAFGLYAVAMESVQPTWLG